jgi:hypothetical protein
MTANHFVSNTSGVSVSAMARNRVRLERSKRLTGPGRARQGVGNRRAPRFLILENLPGGEKSAELIPAFRGVQALARSYAPTP